MGSMGPTGTTVVAGAAPGLAGGWQATPGQRPHYYLTAFEGSRVLLEVELTAFPEGRPITFGAAPDNDLVIRSSYGIVSAHHGALSIGPSGVAVSDLGSTNGLYVNGAKAATFWFSPGDVVSVGRLDSPNYDGVLMVLSPSERSWRTFALGDTPSVTIGRAPGNGLVLPWPSVSASHATMTRTADGWAISDNGSHNGVFVRGRRVSAPVRLSKGDVVFLGACSLVYTGQTLVYSLIPEGVEVCAHDLVMRRPGTDAQGNPLITTDHVSLRIGRGEFVAILGGSGAGKSTLLNELNGTDPATSGMVTVDGVDLYGNYGVLKNSIGYVPQQDIVYDDLKLIDMLRYAAELRMSPDTSKADRERRAHEVLAMLEMEEYAGRYIRSLSGGQRKRASIAVELLADPRLLFLDEPTSGLDPGIEQSLMRKLAQLAHEGRTIVLVTHTTLNVSLCDRVVIMGTGGRLCFEGAPVDALSFFGVPDFVDIYGRITGGQQALSWARRFAAVPRMLPAPPEAHRVRAEDVGAPRSPSFLRQLSTLCRRYVRLIVNDRARLGLLLAQAPLLSLLICLVAGSDTFDVYEGTKSCLFSLACAAFWIGLLDSIQEVCKERVILRREYAGGLKLGAYLASKIGVLGGLCAVQAVLLWAVFVAFEGVPGHELWNPGAELLITSYLVMFSAMCLGLMVSSLFRNADRAIAVAPILIMPQILFSGLVFKLDGLAKTASAVVNCRWGMEAYGTTADLNGLDLQIYRENDKITPDVYEHEAEAAYDFTMAHLLTSWGALVLMSVICLAVCALVLRRAARR